MITRAIVATALILFGAQFGASQEMRDNKLTVYGKVRVFAKADRAKIKFDIKGVGSSLKGAFENARVKLDTIAEKLYAIGLDQTSLSTSFFRNEENLGDKAFLSSKKDFRAVMTVTIATTLMDSLEQIAVILSEGSIERIQSVDFDLVNFGQLRKDAIQQAAITAREKAELAAKSLGVTCGKVFEFEELKAEAVAPEYSSLYRLQGGRTNPFNAPYYAYNSERLDQTGGTIYAQDIQFDAEVRVVFEIVSSGLTGTDSSGH